MSGGWDVARYARFASDVVIVAAGLAVARRLWVLSRRPEAKGPAERSPRALAAFAGLLALCGVSHLAVIAAGQEAAPASASSAGLKVSVAVLWVVAAVRSRGAITSQAPQVPDPRPEGCEGRDPRDVDRVEAKVRRLEDMFNNEPWTIDKADALRELRDVLAELEARRCRT